MTITCLPMDATASTPEYSAQNYRQSIAAQHGGGAGRPLGGRSGFRVDTSSTVLAATSTTWTLTPCAAMLDPGATTHQGMYGWSTDANVTGSVTAADATYARKDIVYIQVNDSSAGDGSGALTADVLYAAGTPSATPVAPDLTGSRARSFLVGTITVPQSGGGSPTVVVNPARYVAAGAVLPINSQTAQDALTQYPASEIVRTDDKFKKYISDGTKWMQPAGAQGLMVDAISNSVDATGQVAHVVLQNIASFPFKAGRKYRIGFEGNYYTDNLDTVVLFRIATCSTADSAGAVTGLTVRNQTDVQPTRVTTGFPVPINAFYRPTADATLQVKITAERVVGSGSFALQRSSVAPNVLYIEDLGAQF